MYRIAASMTALFIIGGNIVSPVTASSPSVVNYESVIVGTIDDSLVLDADTAIDQTTKHPQRRLYQPRRYKSIDDSTPDEISTTKGPARFRFYATWIAGYRGGRGGA